MSKYKKCIFTFIIALFEHILYILCIFIFIILSGGIIMKANAPTKVTLIASIILAVIALIANFVAIPVISGYAFFIMCGAFVVLLLGCLLKGK